MRIRLMMILAALAASGGGQAQPQWQHVGTLGQRHLMVVDTGAAANVALLKQAAASACDPAKPCVVAFWSNAAEVPASMPMSSAQQQAMVAQYVRNPGSGKEEVLLKCTTADPAAAKCLH